MNGAWGRNNYFRLDIRTLLRVYLQQPTSCGLVINFLPGQGYLVVLILLLELF